MEYGALERRPVYQQRRPRPDLSAATAAPATMDAAGTDVDAFDVADELDRLRAEHAAILAAVREDRADDAARTVGDHIRALYERTTVLDEAPAPSGPRPVAVDEAPEGVA